MSEENERLKDILSAFKFKYFKYVPEDAGKSRMVVVNREEILDQFYDIWEKAVIESGKGHALEGLSSAMKRKLCVEDWIIINYAMPVYD